MNLNFDKIDIDVTILPGAAGALGRIDKYELRRELGEGGFGPSISRMTLLPMSMSP